ncbi:hypothetical protein [Sulfuricurvum sp.]|uniref:CCA tRNA nucleotidyltransferase n=1 Tax=Sulfuricurvum sp. TaxID=2025608 RepID=UPI0026098E2B|nr:hypothetical protein [Sulfuricurvum sp.]MDD2780374.1 hypothetical protein [Sulfuricurvum sp.]
MIPLPLCLVKLIEHLSAEGIKAIFVGGFVRDYFTGHATADLDIELYGVTSLEALETLLRPFGKLGLYGKSFGVLKLSYEGYSIDFAPPRTESKSGFGHKGFEVLWVSELDFASAARRRDFTINAIGYDPITQSLLDPYNGVGDLNAKILRCVDPETFVDDPLRILRAIQFAARFTLTCDEQLLLLCQSMIAKGALEELPKERIFEEIKKLLILSNTPSIGLRLLESFGGRRLFGVFDEEAWDETLTRVDQLAQQTYDTPQERLTFLLAALLLHCDDPIGVLERITFHHSLAMRVLKIIMHARKWGTLSQPPIPLLMGRDLIAHGLSPSESFKTILDAAYEAQLNQLFSSRDQALVWLKRYLVTES